MFVTALRRLRQQHRSRQRALAEKVALLAELERTPTMGSLPARGASPIHPASAWEKLFASPEWRGPSVGHDGRCGVCAADVQLHQIHCAQCGAQWSSLPLGQDRKHFRPFCVAAILLSVVTGYGFQGIFSYFVDKSIAAKNVYLLQNAEFISFAESYIFIFVLFVVLLLSTFVYERFYSAPDGAWVSGGRLPAQ